MLHSRDPQLGLVEGWVSDFFHELKCKSIKLEQQINP